MTRVVRRMSSRYPGPAVVIPLRLVHVDGDSMRPTLTPGDRLLVLRRRRYRRGDVVALVDPRASTRTIVKRVAAIEGDDVVVHGDNPDASTDSRSFGPVPVSSIVGRAVYRYAPTARAGRIRGGTV